LLRFEAARPTLYGFEMHLARMNRDLDEFKPTTTIIYTCPMHPDVVQTPRSTAYLRMVDILKTKGITAVMTRLTSEQDHVAGEIRHSL
jgi:circadian clock protein KaiC